MKVVSNLCLDEIERLDINGEPKYQKQCLKTLNKNVTRFKLLLNRKNVVLLKLIYNSTIIVRFKQKKKS